MHRQMLKSKTHRATITDCDVVVHVDDDNEVVAVDSDPTVVLAGVSPEQEALL